MRLPFVDVSAVGEHWSHFGDLRFSSVLLEANYFPVRADYLSPFVTFGLGRSWGGSADHSDAGQGWSGASSSLGVGLQASPWRSTAVRAEALVRDDGGGFIGELRFSAGYAPRAPVPQEGLTHAGVDVLVYQMAPVRGPWRFVEPAYGLRFSRPMTDQLAGSLDFAVFHWQTPGTDTRAFVGLPGVQLQALANDILVVRGGPSVIMMGEGTDAGVNLGAHLQAASTVRPLGIPLTVGAGWLWMSRGPDADARMSPGEDQIGLMLFGGIHL